MSSDEQELIGRSYTRGRRYPRVVGTIQSGMGQRIRLPGGPYSMPQFLVTGISAFLLVKTWSWWGTGSLLDIVALIAVPVALGWTARRARYEGRSAFRAVSGLMRLISAPSAGRHRGRPAALPAITLLRHDALRVTSIEGWAAALPAMAPHLIAGQTTITPPAAATATVTRAPASLPPSPIPISAPVPRSLPAPRSALATLLADHVVDEEKIPA